MFLASYQPLCVQEGEDPQDTIVNMDRDYKDYFGFNPVWCMPMDSPSDFFAHSLLTAPNMPMVVYIVDTENYIKIDKIEHYKRIMCGDESVEGLECDRENRYCEFIINAEELRNAYIIPLMQDYTELIVIPYQVELSDDILDHLYYTAKRFNGMQINVGNVEELKEYYEDEHLYQMHRKGEVFKKQFETCVLTLVWNILMNGTSDIAHIDAVTKDLPAHWKVYQRFVNWFNGDCDTEEYDKIFDSAKALVIEDVNVLTEMRKRDIGRNDQCPCGSGLKFKKCHGRGEKHCFELKM